MPNGPTARTTGPCFFTHNRWGIPASPLIMVGNCPYSKWPWGGPGIERSGDR